MGKREFICACRLAVSKLLVPNTVIFHSNLCLGHYTRLISIFRGFEGVFQSFSHCWKVICVYNESMKKFPILRFWFLVLFLMFTSVRASANLDIENQPNNSLTPKSLTPVSVQLHWHHQFKFAGFYAAIQQGYYRDAGLDVQLKDWHPDLLSVQEVVNQHADFSVAYSSSVADFINGDPIRLVFSNFQVSPMVLISKEPIYSLDQLAGKTIMGHGNSDVVALINKAKERVQQPIIQIDSSGNLQDFIDGKVDLYSVYQTNEPYRLRQQGIPFHLLDPKSFGIQSLGDVVIAHQDTVTNKPHLVQAFKNATIKGWQYAFQSPELVIDFMIENYSVKKSREALLAEATEIPVFVIPEKGQIGDVPLDKVQAAAKNAYQANWISETQWKSFSPEAFVYIPSSVNLTIEEMKYLEANPEIQLGNDSFWEPFEFVDEQGNFSGMSADYFALMEQKLGVKFKHYHQKTWNDVMQAARDREAKILSCAVATPERRQFMDFTRPYLSFPLVLVAKKEVNFIEDYSELSGQVVSVPKGYWSEEWLRNNHPKIGLMPVDTVREGLEAVLRGDADAFSGNLASINFAIKRYGIDGLHIVGESGVRFELAIGVDNQDPVLFGIMQKALASITPEERDAIYKKWIQLELIRKTDHSTLFLVIFGFIAILSIFAWLLWLLHRQKKQQEFYIHQVNELSMASYTNFKTGKIDWVSDSFLQLTGCAREQIIGQSHFCLLHPDEDKELYENFYHQALMGQTVTMEAHARGCDGKSYWAELTASPKVEKGQVVGAWVTRVDITDKKRLEEVATHDALTGVYNRHQFNELFDSLVNQANRQHSQLAVLLFDIDFFKAINDRLGHQEGDKVLTEVARVTQMCFGRTSDFIFRIGGEEFIVVTEFDTVKDFAKYLDKFQQAIRDLKIESPGTQHGVVTISIGALFVESFNKKLNSNCIYSQLDELMYEAKSSGRDKLCLEVIDDEKRCSDSV